MLGGFNEGSMCIKVVDRSEPRIEKAGRRLQARVGLDVQAPKPANPANLHLQLRDWCCRTKLERDRLRPKPWPGWRRYL